MRKYVLVIGDVRATIYYPNSLSTLLEPRAKVLEESKAQLTLRELLSHSWRK